MDSTGGQNDIPDSVAGAGHAQSSHQLSRSAEPRPTEIQTITVPGAAERRDEVELDAQSRTRQPSSNQDSVFTSPLQSLPTPAVAEMASSRMHTPRRTNPYALRAPSSETLFVIANHLPQPPSLLGDSQTLATSPTHPATASPVKIQQRQNLNQEIPLPPPSPPQVQCAPSRGGLPEIFGQPPPGIQGRYRYFRNGMKSIASLCFFCFCCCFCYEDS